MMTKTSKGLPLTNFINLKKINKNINEDIDDNNNEEMNNKKLKKRNLSSSLTTSLSFEKIIKVINLKQNQINNPKKKLLLSTNHGLISKSLLKDIDTINTRGKNIIKLRNNSKLNNIQICSEGDRLLIATE